MYVPHITEKIHLLLFADGWSGRQSTTVTSAATCGKLWTHILSATCNLHLILPIMLLCFRHLTHRWLDRFTSLLYYTMAAESGYAAAQFNVAYLCEQHAVSRPCNCNIAPPLPFNSQESHLCVLPVQHGLLDHDSASSCMWRYYNLTIQSQHPDTYGKKKASFEILSVNIGNWILFSSVSSPDPHGWPARRSQRPFHCCRDVHEGSTQGRSTGLQHTCFLAPRVCICVCVCESSCSSSGVVQPWPPRWRGLQAAVVSPGRTWPLWAVPGGQEFAPEHVVLEVCSRLCSTCRCECVVFNTKMSDKNPFVCSDRCRDSENTDSYLPCSLALFNVHFQSFQKKYGAAMKVSVRMQYTAANQQEHRYTVSVLCLSFCLLQFSAAAAVVAVLCSFGAIRRPVLSISLLPNWA